jgi:hypothetical protein
LDLTIEYDLTIVKFIASGLAHFSLQCNLHFFFFTLVLTMFQLALFD